MAPIYPYPHYKDFTDFTPVIPELYWNVYSSEERIRALCTEWVKLTAYIDGLAGTVNDTNTIIKELEAAFDEFKQSGFLDYYEEQINDWIHENMPDIIEESIKMVFFGLTDDGYFCAYIPDSWSDISFDTGMVYGNFDYGRLMLRYNVDGSGVIDNTGNYSEDSYQELYNIIEALTRRVVTNENTLYTALNRGEV